MNDVIEIATIKLAANKSEMDLIAASDAFQSSFLAAQPGFISRELVKAADGTYADIVRWTSMDAARAIMSKTEGSPACMTYFSVMDMGEGDMDASVSHFTSLRKY